MINPDSSYLAQVTERVVKTFQRYAQNIKPDDESFLAFISDYLAERQVRDIKLLPYSELYKLIKDGIREYLRLQERGHQPRK